MTGGYCNAAVGRNRFSAWYILRDNFLSGKSHSGFGSCVLERRAQLSRSVMSGSWNQQGGLLRSSADAQPGWLSRCCGAVRGGASIGPTPGASVPAASSSSSSSGDKAPAASPAHRSPRILIGWFTARHPSPGERGGALASAGWSNRNDGKGCHWSAGSRSGRSKAERRGGRAASSAPARRRGRRGSLLLGNRCCRPAPSGGLSSR